MRLSNGIRSVAVLEATKGALILLVGFGLLSLVHHDVQRFAERLVAHAHLNPAARYPRIFIEAAGQLTDGRTLLLATGAAVYASVRFIEAYGLWLERKWAEWLAALSGAIYIPFEVLELWKRVTWLSLGALLLNTAVVALMLYSLSQRRRGSVGLGTPD
jgi:uncharacterized membrane protein (DUF2068 family)